MRIRLLCTVMLALGLSACGAKIVKHAPPPPLDRTLAESSSPQLSANLAWITVSEGPGAWVEEAAWDEYFVRVRNTAAVPLTITGVEVEDSRGTVTGAMDTRPDLIKGSRETAKRYKDAGMKVYTGLGGGTLSSLGAASGVAGVAYGSTLSGVGLFGTAGSSSAALGTAAGLMIAAPVLGTMGVVRAVRARKVDRQIRQRSTDLPLTLAPGSEATLDLFYPVAPAPRSVTIAYSDGTTPQRLQIDTHEALAGLHLPPTASAPSQVAATTSPAPAASSASAASAASTTASAPAAANAPVAADASAPAATATTPTGTGTANPR